MKDRLALIIDSSLYIPGSGINIFILAVDNSTLLNYKKGSRRKNSSRKTLKAGLLKENLNEKLTNFFRIFFPFLVISDDEVITPLSNQYG